MLKRLASLLFSTRLMAILFIVYAAAMATATFLDAGQETSPTPFTRHYIYNAFWFEMIHILFVINFLGNIARYKLLRKGKWTTLIFHLAFILIIVGAGITRYLGFEGVMPIREGATATSFLSDKTYLTVFIDGERNGAPQRRRVEKKLDLSTRLDNDFTFDTDFDGKPVRLQFSKFIDGAEEGFIENPDGKKLLKIVEAGDGDRHDHYLEEGKVQNIHNMLFAFNAPTEGAINITVNSDNSYTIESPFEGNATVMATQESFALAKDSLQELKMRALYQVGEMRFVFPEPVAVGNPGIVEAFPKARGQVDALFVTVEANGQTEEVGLLGGKGVSPTMETVEMGDLKVHLAYGSKAVDLPFAITLNDFIAEKYPGTEKVYSAYESKVTVVDEAVENGGFDYDIYMNHILEHKGYRFFQASFDPDEQGTVLSVNHDFYGTWVTYIGYFLLYLGLMLILFDKGSRFGHLKVMLDKVKAKKAALTVVILFFALSESLYAQEVVVKNGNTEIVQTPESLTPALTPEEAHAPNHGMASKAEIDSILLKNAVSVEHAEKFGKLVIQDDRGRMMPVNTFSSLILRKLSRKDTYLGLNADQVFHSMIESPVFWYSVDFIYITEKNDSLRAIIGVPKDREYIKAIEFFDEQGRYKLAPYLEQAYAADVKTNFDKDFIDISERLALLDRALSGEILKVFPLPNDENNKWVSYPELGTAGFKEMDSVYTRQILPLYFQATRAAKTSGDYSQADQLLESISGFQERYGSAVLPSQQKIDAEVFYNKHDIFTKLFWMYLLASLVLFVFVITQIFKDSRLIRILVGISIAIIAVLFLLHTGGLIWRWYISGHAPWSDAYESILYVGWATMFFGLAFGRKSTLTIASTAFVAGFILWGASMNWLNPAIANLQPVLDSYWLMIHVAVIVASYGPFTLGMILGLVSLLLILLTTEKNKTKMKLNVKELTIITEMSLTVGLIMLTIGNFLGGQWANESWGRYWGWDPKETWALISIMVYAFVIHMRLVPGLLRSKWFFNLMSVLAYGSILMTYFGVNFWLSGLHSYASGENVLNLNKALMMFGSVIVFALIALPKYNKYYKK